LAISIFAAGAAAIAFSESRVAAPKARQQTANPNTLRHAPISNISIGRNSFSRRIKGTRLAKTQVRDLQNSANSLLARAAHQSNVETVTLTSRDREGAAPFTRFGGVLQAARVAGNALAG